jgi:hypothetical protein
MTSKRKIKANRQNATRSAGPGTRGGKARASHNAYRHGLAVSVLNDPAISTEVERLARAIVGKRGEPYELLQARIVAEAEFELLRVRTTRAKMIDSAGRLSFEVEIAPHALLGALPQLEMFDRYERRVFSRRRRAIRQMYASSI